MDVRTTLQQQMQSLHSTMEAAIHDCSGEMLARTLPGATINSIGAIYAHTVFSEDGLLNGLIKGGTPVYYAGGWAEKVGLDMPKGGMEPDWAVTLDLDLFRNYAAAVYHASYEYIATASDAELERVIDPGFMPATAVQPFVANVLAWHVATHQGEISALKGVQGVNGLVFEH